MNVRIRPALAADAATVHGFIQGLAEYEREPGAVEVTPAQLAEQLALENPPFECLLAESADGPVGFALFFHNYSTFLGQRGIYLEDLYVRPEHRARGCGKALLQHLAQLAVERKCGRLEWAVLDWNEPALGFYRRLGAEALSGWVVHRLTGEPLRQLAASGDLPPG